MDKMIFFLVIAFLANEALSMNIRHKRQSDSDDDNDLGDRYFDFQGSNQPWPFPGQTQQNPWPLPSQNQNQSQRPNQGWNNGWGNQNGQNGQTGQNGQGPQPTTRPNPNGSTTQAPMVAACISSCPVTPEYNPVCGSDGTTYSNPGRLSCAQSCGVNVNLSRSAPCPTTTTAAPRT